MDWDAISNAIESFRDGPWDAPIHIILIIIFAFVATKLASIAINRVVNRATKKSTAIDFSDLRNTTDIQNVSDQLLENRVSQRANALGSLARSAAVIVIWTVAVLTIMTEVGINVGHGGALLVIRSWLVMDGWLMVPMRNAEASCCPTACR